MIVPFITLQNVKYNYTFHLTDTAKKDKMKTTSILIGGNHENTRIQVKVVGKAVGIV